MSCFGVDIWPGSKWLQILHSAHKERLSLQCLFSLWLLAQKYAQPIDVSRGWVLAKAGSGKKLNRLKVQQWLTKHPKFFGTSELDELPVKEMKILHGWNIHSRAQLVDTYTLEELLLQANMGPSRIKIIIDWLAKGELQLRRSSPMRPLAELTPSAQGLIRLLIGNAKKRSYTPHLELELLSKHLCETESFGLCFSLIPIYDKIVNGPCVAKHMDCSRSILTIIFSFEI